MADYTLKELVDFLDRGLITREEFDQQKQALLSGGTGSSDPTAKLSHIGPYTIGDLIGEGGMGRVFTARHRTAEFAARQGGDVALKVLHAHYSRRSDIMQRFEREAALGIQLEHPGIVRVHELVVDGGQVALAMEKVEGRALSEIIGQETGPIPWERAWPMFRQLLDAVGYAHSKKVVHRDLKPENVIVGPDGTLKVLDFGIAKEMERGGTQTSVGMGTPDYMAPEQWEDAKRVDARADVYALGMTLYEMLAGRLPWKKGASLPEVLKAKIGGELPPPTDFYPDIPPGVVEAIIRATAFEHEDRYADIGEMHAALKEEALKPPQAKSTAESAPPILPHAPPETLPPDAGPDNAPKLQRLSQGKSATSNAPTRAAESDSGAVRRSADFGKSGDRPAEPKDSSSTESHSKTQVQSGSQSRSAYGLAFAALLSSLVGGFLYFNQKKVEMPPEMLRALEIDLQQGLWGTDAEVVALLESACEGDYEPACDWLVGRLPLPDVAPDTMMRLRSAKAVFRDIESDPLAMLVWGWAGTQVRPGGVLEEQPQVQMPPWKTAYSHIERACGEHRMLRACVEQGRLLAEGVGVVEDDSQAVDLYRQACLGGDMRGCSNLGYMWFNGEGEPKDDVQAKALYRQACEGGEMRGCVNLGTLLYDKGEGEAEDQIQAVDLYRQACEGGLMYGCSRLGFTYRYSQGVVGDAVQALSLYRQACEGGAMSGCSGLGGMYDFGEGVAEDDVQAKAFYRQACEGGDEGGCLFMSFLP